MLLSKYECIFIHVPKTAGNAQQEILLPFSDDEKVLSGHRDGIDRYELRGPVTLHKHATLADYQEGLGPNFLRFKVAISIRHPFQRAISYYFSPHRWFRENNDGSFHLEPSYWDRDEFFRTLEQLQSMKSFLKTADGYYRPDYIIRHETLKNDLINFCRKARIPADVASLDLRNKGTGTPGLINNLEQDANLRRQVEELFSDDMDFFGY